MANVKKTNGKDPAVLLYTQDFIVGTLTMTNEERGKYILLLCMQHQKGKLTLRDLQSVLSDEDELLAEKFPMQSDGFYYNERMQMEIENRKVRTDSSRENGKKGGRPKKETENKPMGFNSDNLNVTYLKSRYNLTGNGNENEAGADYENIIADDTVNNNTSKPKYTKILNGLLQIEDKQLFNNCVEDMNEVGFEIIAQNNGWCEDVYNNYIDRINANYNIINQ